MNPIAGVRIGLIEGRYVVNPTYDEVRESRLNLIVAGTEEAIVMVEAGASEVSEEIMLEALMLAHKEINRLCRWQKELYKALDIQKREVVPPQLNEEMLGEVQRNYADRLRTAVTQPIAVGNLNLMVGVSVGIAMSTAGRTEPATLLARADRGMYAEKRGNNGPD